MRNNSNIEFAVYSDYTYPPDHCIIVNGFVNNDKKNVISNKRYIKREKCNNHNTFYCMENQCAFALSHAHNSLESIKPHTPILESTHIITYNAMSVFPG